MDLCSQTPVVVTVVGGVMIKCLWAVVTLILGCVALNVARKVAVRWLEARSCREKALMEERMRRDKERCDMAWRFIDRCWKVEHPSSAEDATVSGSLTDQERRLYDEAWAYIRSQWGDNARTEDNTEVS